MASASSTPTTLAFRSPAKIIVVDNKAPLKQLKMAQKRFLCHVAIIKSGDIIAALLMVISIYIGLACSPKSSFPDNESNTALVLMQSFLAIAIIAILLDIIMTAAGAIQITTRLDSMQEVFSAVVTSVMTTLASSFLCFGILVIGMIICAKMGILFLSGLTTALSSAALIAALYFLARFGFSIACLYAEYRFEKENQRILNAIEELTTTIEFKKNLANPIISVIGTGKIVEEGAKAVKVTENEIAQEDPKGPVRLTRIAHIETAPAPRVQAVSLPTDKTVSLCDKEPYKAASIATLPA